MGKDVKESVRIFRFIIIGTLNALIAFVIIWVMMRWLGCGYIWSNVVGYIATLINNFFWCKYWIFSDSEGSFFREVPLFLIAFGAAYGAQFVSLLLMVELCHINEYLAQFLGVFVYGAVNFIMNKKVTFKAIR